MTLLQKTKWDRTRNEKKGPNVTAATSNYEVFSQHCWLANRDTKPWPIQIGHNSAEYSVITAGCLRSRLTPSRFDLGRRTCMRCSLINHSTLRHQSNSATALQSHEDKSIAGSSPLLSNSIRPKHANKSDDKGQCSKNTTCLKKPMSSNSQQESDLIPTD